VMAPASTEPFAIPTVDGGRLDQHQRFPPPGPPPSQQQPEQTVRWAKAPIRTSEYTQLMAQGKIFEHEVSTRGQGYPSRSDRLQDVSHRR
jgi:hypothetical protein